MKKTALLSVLGLLISGFATAGTNTFEVTFDVQDISNELTVEEVSPLVFPTIFIDGSIEVGSYCTTHRDDYSNLCPGSTSETDTRKSGVYRVLGRENTTVTATISNFETAVNGFKLIPYFDGDASSATVTIGAEGQMDLKVQGWLQFVDLDQFTEGQTTMSFDITTSYN